KGNSMNMSMGTEPRYKTDLNWLQRLSEFSPAEQRVLLKTALFKARMRKAGTQVLLRWSREWELPLSLETISAGEADSRGAPIPFPRSGAVGAGSWGRRGKTAWPCTSGPGMPSKIDQTDPHCNGSETLVTGGEVLPEMIKRKCHKSPRSRVIRLYSRLQGRLKVEWPLFEREEGLQYLLIESDLDISAQCRWDVGIVGKHHGLPVA